MELTPVPGAEPRYDDQGNVIMDIVTCGTCGRSWNDAAVSGVTPAPSGRCPFEYDHEEVDHKGWWENDLVQFARLLCEITATQDLNINDLCESMDLCPDDLDELFERAHVVFERAKM